MAPRFRWLVACSFLLLACQERSPTEGAAVASPATARAPVPSESEAITEVARVKATGQLGPGRGTLVIDLQPGSGRELTEGSPLRVQGTGQNLSFPEPIRSELTSRDLPLRLPIIVDDGALGPADLRLTYYTCSVGHQGSCRPERTRLTVELDLSGTAEGGEAHLTHKAGS